MRGGSHWNDLVLGLVGRCNLEPEVTTTQQIYAPGKVEESNAAACTRQCTPGKLRNPTPLRPHKAAHARTKREILCHLTLAGPYTRKLEKSYATLHLQGSAYQENEKSYAT